MLRHLAQSLLVFSLVVAAAGCAAEDGCVPEDADIALTSLIQVKLESQQRDHLAIPLRASSAPLRAWAKQHLALGGDSYSMSLMGKVALCFMVIAFLLIF